VPSTQKISKNKGIDLTLQGNKEKDQKVKGNKIEKHQGTMPRQTDKDDDDGSKKGKLEILSKTEKLERDVEFNKGFEIKAFSKEKPGKIQGRNTQNTEGSEQKSQNQSKKAKKGKNKK
jgi:hypothetical protein